MQAKDKQLEERESIFDQKCVALQAAERERDELSLQLHSASERCESLVSQLEEVNAAAAEVTARYQRLFDDSLSAAERVSSLSVVQEYVRDRLVDIEERLLACNERLTEVGFDARRYRMQAEAEHDARVYHAAREHAASSLLREITASRSWRWTLPLRVVSRFARSGRFDAAGNVGLFEAVRQIGVRMPITQPMRSRLGRWLRRLRRH